MKLSTLALHWNVTNYGTLIALEPRTDYAREWVNECVDIPDYMRVGVSEVFYAEPRYARDILQGFAHELETASAR